MTRIAVVIPYFQRTPGILSRALGSAFQQDIGGAVAVDILIIDDQSPSPPELEIKGLERKGFTIRIVKRANGGPARARNTGLEAAGDADFIAFLDSDDTWSPSHLSRAIEALQHGSNFYFANNWYDEGQTWFDGLASVSALITASTPLSENPSTRLIERDALMPLLIEECLPHTSAVAFRRQAYAALRFDEDQLIAGEDHLFWLALADGASQTAFTTEPMAARGRGVDIYRAALDWDHPDCVRRLYFKLILHKKIKKRFARDSATRNRAAADIAALRRGILYLLIRNARRHPAQNAEVLTMLRIADPSFFWTLPLSLPPVVWGKARGDFAFFPHG